MRGRLVQWAQNGLRNACGSRQEQRAPGRGVGSQGHHWHHAARHPPRAQASASHPDHFCLGAAGNSEHPPGSHADAGPAGDIMAAGLGAGAKRAPRRQGHRTHAHTQPSPFYSIGVPPAGVPPRVQQPGWHLDSPQGGRQLEAGSVASSLKALPSNSLQGHFAPCAHQPLRFYNVGQRLAGPLRPARNLAGTWCTVALQAISGRARATRALIPHRWAQTVILMPFGVVCSRSRPAGAVAIQT